MHADRKPHVGPERRHFRRTLDLRIVIGRQDDQRVGKLCVTGALDDGLEIGGEFFAREMAV
jgi:hypothetical protein